MSTFFDFLTIACFLALLGAYLFLSDRDTKTVLHLLVPAIVFAIANQVGNSGATTLALIMIAAGAGYTAFALRR
jgi:NhaP-type Na+/H+ or K+/H+ antiporter